jgi:hypothetical protein
MKTTMLTDLSLPVVFFSYKIATSTKMPQGDQNKTKYVINHKQYYQPLHSEALAITAEHLHC